MNDREQIALLRRRIEQLETGIDAFLGVLTRTGTQRERAWDALRAAQRESDEAAALARAWQFVAVYERTLPHRKAAVAALNDVLQTDFTTALLSCADLTPEQEREWTDAAEHEA